ncbi:hypothetical protein RHMOL_Rhmol12G0025700 [Rhododendron molle]|uniref:Uncharacterized protein n=1 Tax=Rhododendron molle TaxID=49168 RepID=A0ACC0LDL0_RHOML|nr:hypothetical protein RHMOL_Rhmol12G0025700 [Rhododendron molle]
METPFFRNFRGVPVEPAQRKPKVVSIPVRFVNSEKKPATRSSSAVKIQKVFRGFLVRKSVNKIASIRREVEGIERRISQNDAVELIRRENKERLRLNETLMALLFKLDSVRGNWADRTPSLGVGKPDDKEAADVVNSHDLSRETRDESGEVHCSDEEEAISGTMDDQEIDVDLADASHAPGIKQSVENFGDSDKSANRAPSLEVGEADGKEKADDLNDGDFSGKTVDESGEVHCPGEAEAIFETMDDEKMDTIAKVGVGSKAEEDEEGCIVKQVVEDKLPTSEFVEERGETGSHVSNGIGDQNTSERQKDRASGEGDDRTRDTELLERMMEENEKMISLMTQLYEKNEAQTRMLSSLSHRVGQLERALICERLRKKKKRHAAGTVDCSEVDISSEPIPDQKKCGKRL